MADHISTLFDGGVDATTAAGGIAGGGQSGGLPFDKGGGEGAGAAPEGASADSKPANEHVGDDEAGAGNASGAAGAEEGLEHPGEDTGDGSDTGEGAQAGKESPSNAQANEAAERLQSILDENGYADIDELMADVETGRTLKDILGSRDAKKVVDDADTLDRYKQVWAAEELEEQRRNETESDRIARLEKENKDLKNAIQTNQNKAKEAETAEKSLRILSSEVDRILGKVAPDMGESEREMALLVLGVDNPMDDIDDIGNVRLVRPTATNLAKKFSKFIADIKQQAIDEYAAGKSDFKPLDKGGTDTNAQGVKETRLVTDKDDSRTGFAKAGERFREVLHRLANAE